MTRGQIALSIVITAGFIILTALMALYRADMPAWVQQNFNLVVGAWIVNFTTVVNWFFGSSKGSSDKTAALIRDRAA